MPVIDQLASLLLTAERASSDSAVTIDIFPRNETQAAGSGLRPMWAGQAPIGRIVAEDGRVCWIMAKGCDTTVSDLLAAETGIPRKQLEDVYEVARTEGSPFCEVLASAGLVSPDDVRNTLRRQTAAAAVTLARMDTEDDTVVSVARIPRGTYDAQFTYDALTVLATATGESAELRAELGSAPESYKQLAPQVEAALCFRESEASDLTLIPIAVTAGSGLLFASALELALEALAATEPADPVLAEIAPLPLVVRGDSEWWLCDHTAPHLCLYQINSRDDYLRVLETLVLARRAA